MEQAVQEFKYAIIIGTVRKGRFGGKPAAWLHESAQRRPGVHYDLIDLRDHPLPLFDDEVPPTRGPSSSEVGRKWRAELARYDGFVFVVAEYNHGISGALKNALDYPYPELNRKPAAFVGYGGAGGARAVEQLRLILIELQMAPLRNAVHIGMPDFGSLASGKASFDDLGHIGSAAGKMLDDLEWWGRALAEARRHASGTVKI
jgi:NAD(P)H-dependent FMN reductase